MARALDLEMIDKKRETKNAPKHPSEANSSRSIKTIGFTSLIQFPEHSCFFPCIGSGFRARTVSSATSWKGRFSRRNKERIVAEYSRSVEKRRRSFWEASKWTAQSSQFSVWRSAGTTSPTFIKHILYILAALPRRYIRRLTAPYGNIALANKVPRVVFKSWNAGDAFWVFYKTPIKSILLHLHEYLYRTIKC